MKAHQSVRPPSEPAPCQFAESRDRRRFAMGTRTVDVPADDDITAARRPARRHIRLLQHDPELGSALATNDFGLAYDRLIVSVLGAQKGTFSDRSLARVSADGFGLLVLDGILARETLLSDQISTELLGAGDPIRPQQPQDPTKLLRSEIRWTIVEPVHFAVLDAAFAERASEFPEVGDALVGRLFERTHRLAAIQALSQLTGVPRRILALLWHLAERWGQVGSDGVHLPLHIPHRLIANLVGARRPTVSSALHSLVRDDAITPLETGGWVLHGEPFGAPTEETARVVELRRRRSHRPAASLRDTADA